MKMKGFSLAQEAGGFAVHQAVKALPPSATPLIYNERVMKKQFMIL
jgi:hypothetical protein